jgi:hypothetical protein
VHSREAASVETNSRFSAAKEMDEQENYRKKKKKVNQRGCHMEDDERTNPREEQK